MTWKFKNPRAVHTSVNFTRTEVLENTVLQDETLGKKNNNRRINRTAVEQMKNYQNENIIDFITSKKK